MLVSAFHPYFSMSSVHSLNMILLTVVATIKQLNLAQPFPKDSHG